MQPTIPIRQNKKKRVQKSNKIDSEDIHSIIDNLFVSDVAVYKAKYLHDIIKHHELYPELYVKEKVRTLTVALVLCLHLDVDPPGVPKVYPYSRLEAWYDPTEVNGGEAIEKIGKNLQAQYERWQPRARYKLCLDPTLDDVKRLCISLRRNTKEDRILFHYNGHGVPSPTLKGEVWVFNSKFTKYIPLSLYDLQRWIGIPTVYVFDCHNAGTILRMYETFCERRRNEATSAKQSSQQQQKPHHGDSGTNSSSSTSHEHHRHHHHNHHEDGSSTASSSGQSVAASWPADTALDQSILLGACQESEFLPQCADVPADLFTACLTTPIKMGIKWHASRHQQYFPDYLDESLLDRLPGTPTNRMSLLGEVNWIFTAVTDTIAWRSLPVDLFNKLFRQDLLVASLFRNFLLADRIMRNYGCHPVSIPSLPSTHRHEMWLAWDHALDRVFHCLPHYLAIIEGTPNNERHLPIITSSTGGDQLPAGAVVGVANRSAVSNQNSAQLPPPQHQQAYQQSDCNRPRNAVGGEAINGQQLAPNIAVPPATIVDSSSTTVAATIKKPTKGPLPPPMPEQLPKFRSSNANQVAGEVNNVQDQKTSKDSRPLLVKLLSSNRPLNKSCDDYFGQRHSPRRHDTSNLILLVPLRRRTVSSAGNICPTTTPRPPVQMTIGDDAFQVQQQNVADTNGEKIENVKEMDANESHQANPQGLRRQGKSARHALYALTTTKQDDSRHQQPACPPRPSKEQEEIKESSDAVVTDSSTRPITRPQHQQPSRLTTGPVDSVKFGGVSKPLSDRRPIATNQQQSSMPTLRSLGPALFFTHQMTAFKLWLQNSANCSDPSSSALQLPVLVQILLSTSHRLRAMQLICRFLDDLGPWAVERCLAVGIFPYIVRLLSYTSGDIRAHLVFIWAKIAASAQTDLGRNDSLRELSVNYFMNCLHDTSQVPAFIRTLAVFLLTSMLDKDYTNQPDPLLQDFYLRHNFVPLALKQLYESPPRQSSPILVKLRQWLMFGLSRIWWKNDNARWYAIRHNVIEYLFPYFEDISPEVRAATAQALTSLIDQNNSASESGGGDSESQIDEINHRIARQMVHYHSLDSSWLVRVELTVGLARFVARYECQMIAICEQRIREVRMTSPSPVQAVRRYSTVAGRSPNRAGLVGISNNVYAQVWTAIVQLARDPYPKVSKMAGAIVEFLLSKAQFNSVLPTPTHVTFKSIGSADAINKLTSPSQQQDTSPACLQSIQPASTKGAASSSLDRLAQDEHSSNSSSGTSSPIPSRMTRRSLDNLSVDQLSANSQQQSETVTRPQTLAYRTPTRGEGDTCARSTGGTPSRRASVVIHTGTGTPVPHSVQFTPRRNRTLDLLLNRSKLSPPPATPTDDLQPSQPHILDTECQSDFLYWSFGWFTEPLLAKYGVDSGIASPPESPPPPQRHSTANSTQSLAHHFSDDDLHLLFPPHVVQNVLRVKRVRQCIDTGRSNWTSLAVDLDDQSKPLSRLVDSRLVTSDDYRQAASSCLTFHPFQPRLVVGKADGNLTVYDTAKVNSPQVVAQLNNLQCDHRSPFPNQLAWCLSWPITGIEFLNASQPSPLLLTLSSDGLIRIWRNYDSEPDLVTAWRGLSDPSLFAPQPPVSSLDAVCCWSQTSRQLALAGRSRHIRLWDCQVERRLRDLTVVTSSAADASVNCLHRGLASNLLVAGLSNGAVKLFDVRSRSSDKPVYTTHNISSPVVNVSLDGAAANSLHAIFASGFVGQWQLSNASTCVVSRGGSSRHSSKLATPPLKVSWSMSIPPSCSSLTLANSSIVSAAYKIDAFGTSSSSIPRRLFLASSTPSNDKSSSARGSILMHRLDSSHLDLRLLCNLSSRPTSIALHPFMIDAFGTSSSSIPRRLFLASSTPSNDKSSSARGSILMHRLDSSHLDLRLLCNLSSRPTSIALHPFMPTIAVGCVDKSFLMYHLTTTTSSSKC